MKQLLVIFITLLFTINSTNADDSCVYDRCKCDYKKDELHIYCKSINVFPRTYEKIQDKINSFSITGNKIQSLPEDGFKNLRIDYLIISNNNITKLNSNSLRGIKYLSKLKLSEENFNTIEPNAFNWVKYTLAELELSKVELNSIRMDAFSNEFNVLKSLKVLKLHDNNLHEFKLEWISKFKNLKVLALTKNKFANLNSDIFISNDKIRVFDLTDNSFDDLNNILKALDPIRTDLKELLIAKNSIESLSNFKGFKSLKILDLSSNRIKILPNGAFDDLAELRYLYLSNNQIITIDNAAFGGLNHLAALNLSNNYISLVPAITRLDKLLSLDLSNQNSKLKNLNDYAFERSNPIYNLDIKLNSNELETFSPKAFCSHFSSYSNIKSINMSALSMKRINTCILKQLVSDQPIEVELNIEKSSKELSLGCELKSYLSELNIKLNGECKSTNKTLNAENLKVQGCKDFSCSGLKN